MQSNHGVITTKKLKKSYHYQYGDHHAGNNAGRIIKQQDASGVQTFKYGKLGELIGNIHTFVVPGGETYSFAMNWTYDSWNRLQNITYPDGEVVSYTNYGKTIQCVIPLSEMDEPEKEVYFYHSDHIGSSSFITDRNGYASQHLQYLPFGEPNRPLAVSSRIPLNHNTFYEQLFVEQRSTANYYTPYKFSGKEKDEETSYSYFGARYYMSDVSVWLSVDPMSDKRSWLSPYNYCQLNPVMRVDPTGMLDWEPEIDGNGNTSYKAEKGDSKTTLKSQYGLSEEQASKILTDSKLPQNGEIKEGSKISGESVKKVTGSDVLKLDWVSPQATDQRKVDQIMFGVKKSQVNGKDFLDLKDFNTNMYNGGAGFNAQNVTIKVGNERIPILIINLTNDWNTKNDVIWTTSQTNLWR